MPLNRRDLLAGGTVGAMALGSTTSGVLAQTPNRAATAATVEVTSRLAKYVVAARYEDLPANVRSEARRTFLNWAGCAVGGSQTDTVNNVLVGAQGPEDHLPAAFRIVVGAPSAPIGLRLFSSQTYSCICSPGVRL